MQIGLLMNPATVKFKADKVLASALSALKWGVDNHSCTPLRGVIPATRNFAQLNVSLAVIAQRFVDSRLKYVLLFDA